MRFLTSFYKAAEALRKEVSCVGVIYDGKILMGKRRDSQRYTNPGGHLDPGEKPLAGAVRELYEESGIRAAPEDLEPVATESVTTPKGQKYVIHAFALRLKEKPSTSMKEDPDAEVYRWQWIPMPLPENILNNLHSPKNVLLKALGLQEQEKTAYRKLIPKKKEFLGLLHESAKQGVQSKSQKND